jgi:hypothetical protein
MEKIKEAGTSRGFWEYNKPVQEAKIEIPVE